MIQGATLGINEGSGAYILVGCCPSRYDVFIGMYLGRPVDQKDKVPIVRETSSRSIVFRKSYSAGESNAP
jgi:hypothetical protein